MAGSARIIVITGDGKGKTTAAMGMAMRASGHGIHSAVIQFVKRSKTGETETIKGIDSIDFLQTGLGFLPEDTEADFQEHKAAAQQGLSLAANAIASQKYNMIILDEICFAISKGLLNADEVVAVIAKALPNQCIVLTGRGATETIIDLADTVSEITCVKHGFDSGIPAQKGVEY